jgi:recombination protein RecT
MINTNLAQAQQPATIKTLLNNESIKKRFSELLGKKASGFISSLMQVAQNNKALATADPNSILAAAVTAASLDLPINQNLGFAWIVPVKGNAQFQMGWKGYVQLALRSGQ